MQDEYNDFLLPNITLAILGGTWSNLWKHDFEPFAVHYWLLKIEGELRSYLTPYIYWQLTMYLYVSTKTTFYTLERSNIKEAICTHRQTWPKHAHDLAIGTW